MMDRKGFKKLQEVNGAGENSLVQWKAGDDAIPGNFNVRYVTAEVRNGGTPAGLLNALVGKELLEGSTTRQPLTAPKLRLLGDLSMYNEVGFSMTFEDVNFVPAEDPAHFDPTKFRGWGQDQEPGSGVQGHVIG